MSTPAAPISLDDLRDRSAALMLRDRIRMEGRIDGAGRTRGEAARSAAIAKIARDVEAAERRIESRRRSVPEPRYPEGLPLVGRREDILAAIRDHQVVVVAGETGSGKTTQLPKICLELGRGLRGMIGHTQPRRIAARTVAERIAEELGTPLGATIGYKVRFTDRVSDATLLKVMTDGILLAELQRDRLLTRYDTVIIDEAHERSLNIDFLLGYLKQLLPRRPDLKIVVTSATIDTERFSRHFDGAPIIEVSGRTYPVEIRYRPLDDGGDDRDQTQAIVDAVAELSAAGRGDVLVFLSGEREIRDTAEALTRSDNSITEVLPLYARLSPAEQHRVFQPHSGRRVVLATNVAETSLTVPGIRYVVDPGTARVSRFNRRTKVQRLPIEAVSQASANQRAGRCGRVAPGICIRLYSEDDFDARPAYTDPEVLRTNLASVILQMTALDLGDVAAFPFVDPPDIRSIKDGIALLTELGALEPGGASAPRLTTIGRQLAQLPVDPRFARMVLEADRQGCLAEVLVLAAGLSIQDPRVRPTDDRQAAADLHARFHDPGSDFVAYLNLWAYLQRQQEDLSSSAFRRLCKAEYLNYLRVREWQDLHSQLRQVAKELRLEGAEEPAGPAAVHRAVLAGLLSHIGHRDADTKEYRGARDARFALAPGSALSQSPPRWVMAGELVETNRLWGRIAARIEPAWAERLGSHLVKRTYGEPSWDAQRATAVTDERVTLYGLPLAVRRVDYARVDARGARDMFIRHALVEGEWPSRHAFADFNAKLLDEVQDLEDRARRRLLVDNDSIFDFYDQRVGAGVASGRDFDRWWARTRARQPELLNFSLATLLGPEAGDLSAEAFPDVWRQRDLVLPLSYVFEPGAPDDGVSVDVPLGLLPRVSAAGFEWQVPGLREELVTALIRSLPKQVRRSFVPAPDYARAFLERAAPADGPLVERLESVLPVMTGDPLPPDSWQWDRVPDHLRITFRVQDETGATIALGKSIDALNRLLREHMASALSAGARAIERRGISAWDFGELPRCLEIEVTGYPVAAYPTLVDDGATVSIRVVVSAAEQDKAMWTGTRRLLLLTCPVSAKALSRALSPNVRLSLGHAGRDTVEDLVADCTAAAVDKLLADHGGPVWSAADFATLRSDVRSGLLDTAVAVVTFAGRVMVEAARVETRLAAMTSTSFDASVSDMRAQLATLAGPGFVKAAGARRLPDVLRYVRAIDRRIDKLPEDPFRDRARMRRIQQLTAEFENARAHLSSAPLEALEIRWMIEELRVSEFAQILGTARPVSPERVRRAIAELRH